MPLMVRVGRIFSVDLLRDFRCRLTAEFRGRDGSSNRRQALWGVIVLALLVAVIQLSMAQSLTAAIQNGLLALGFILILVAGGVLAGTLLIDYVVPFAIWLPLHWMNKAPRGVVGSLGLLVAAVSFLSR